MASKSGWLERVGCTKLGRIPNVRDFQSDRNKCTPQGVLASDSVRCLLLFRNGMNQMAYVRALERLTGAEMEKLYGHRGSRLRKIPDSAPIKVA